MTIPSSSRDARDARAGALHPTGSWAFAYAYCMAFIAGEVKRPDKTIILANLFAVLVPGIFCLWTAIALYQLDFNFLSAAFYADNLDNYAWSIEGFNLPFSSNYIGLAFPRIIFAWGMDRMGPKWSPCSASPRSRRCCSPT